MKHIFRLVLVGAILTGCNIQVSGTNIASGNKVSTGGRGAVTKASPVASSTDAPAIGHPSEEIKWDGFKPTEGETLSSQYKTVVFSVPSLDEAKSYEWAIKKGAKNVAGDLLDEVAGISSFNNDGTMGRLSKDLDDGDYSYQLIAFADVGRKKRLAESGWITFSKKTTAPTPTPAPLVVWDMSAFAPTDGSTIRSSTVEFKASTVAGATAYELKVQSPSGTVYSSTSETPTFSWTEATSGSYRFQVTAVLPPEHPPGHLTPSSWVQFIVELPKVAGQE